MENLTYLFVFVASVSLMLVLVALRWTHSRLARALILALFALLLPAAYAAPASLLGRAKPVSLEWLGAHVQEASILSASYVEGEAIYLTLQWGQVLISIASPGTAIPPSSFSRPCATRSATAAPP